MRSLYQCLLDTERARLRAIARFWDVDLATSRPQDAAAQLAQAMSAPQAVTEAWNALPDDQRRALEALLAVEGRMPLQVFARQWGEIRTMGPGRMEREQPWQEPASPTEGLWYRGFVSRAFTHGPGGSYEVIFIPPELQAHLPAPRTSPPVITLEPSSEPAKVRSDGDKLLDDACTLLAYLQNERLRLEPGGDWPARHQARLAQRMHDPDPARLAFLHHLVRRLGWLRVIDSGHLRPDPAPATVWLQSSTAQQRGALAAGWRDDPTWNDLFHVPSLRCEDVGAWRNDPLVARGAILRHVRACALDAWYGLDDFVAAVKQTDPDFQRPGGDYTSWYIRDAATGAYLSGFESWDVVDGALIRYVITGPLAWLGLIDVGMARPDGSPAAFRLSPAGLAFLGLAEPPPEPESAPLVLRPDSTVLAPPARRHKRFQLARVADWVRTGTPFVYRLTPASLARARRQGIGVARVLEFLDRATGVPVPSVVQAALTRWEAHGVEVRLERVVLLRLSSPELMAQVKASSLTRHLIGEQVGPTTALVHERDWPRLAAALCGMGLLPDVITLEEDHAD
jgi:hypothetical protein